MICQRPPPAPFPEQTGPPQLGIRISLICVALAGACPLPSTAAETTPERPQHLRGTGKKFLIKHREGVHPIVLDIEDAGNGALNAHGKQRFCPG